MVLWGTNPPSSQLAFQIIIPCPKNLFLWFLGCWVASGMILDAVTPGVLWKAMWWYLVDKSVGIEGGRDHYIPGKKNWGWLPGGGDAWGGLFSVSNLSLGVRGHRAGISGREASVSRCIEEGHRVWQDWTKGTGLLWDRGEGQPSQNSRDPLV